MSSQNIYPFQTGLDTETEPWLLPPDAFTNVENFYIHHGYLGKRNGMIVFGKLVNERVMGIFQYIATDGTKTTYAFDRRFGYLFNAVGDVFVQFALAEFTGDVYDYFWGVNYQANTVTGGLTVNPNRLYVTNGKKINNPTIAPPTTDGIRYIDSNVATTAISLIPADSLLGGTLGMADARHLWGAKHIFSIGQRLLVLNTFEGTLASGGLHYPQRARWCAKANPANWNDVTAGGGGYTDAATGDQIVSARQIQNQVIVTFTNSVWMISPTSDPNRAFRWQKINNFRACNGKMASVSYDRYIVTLGDRGIVGTDGVESRRVDDRIQTLTTNTINKDEFGKVFCERNYDNKRWWTLYPSVDQTENNKALIYDDDSNAYTEYEIGLNVLGFANKSRDYGLDDFILANNLDFNLKQVGDNTIQDYFFQQESNDFVGGDIYGNVFILDSGGDDLVWNTTTMMLDSTPIECSFSSAAWNPYKDENKEAKMPYIDFYVTTDLVTTARIDFFTDSEDDAYLSQDMDFLPPMNFIGPIISVGLTNPALVNAANHGLVTGDQTYIYQVLGMGLDPIAPFTGINSDEGNGIYTITRVDDDFFTLDGKDATVFAAAGTSGGMYKKEFYRTKVWKRVYAGGTGFQHRIFFISKSSNAPLRLSGMKPWFKPTGKRLIN